MRSFLSGKFSIALMSVIVLILTAASFSMLEGSGREISWFSSLLRFGERFFPPDFSDFPIWIESLIESLKIAWLATGLSLLPSLIIAFFASSWSPALVRFFMLGLLSFLRSIPSLLLALLAVALVGPYPLAGVLALIFYSIGYLGKFFSDDFNSLDLGLMRTYQQWGVPTFPAFRYGLWPQVKKRVIAHFFWMLEYNFRSSTIIGYVGAGGIGVHLIAYQEYAQWDRFFAVILVIASIVFATELRRFKKT